MVHVRGGGPASRSFSCESQIDGTRAECVGEGVGRDEGGSRVGVSSYVSFAVPSGARGQMCEVARTGGAPRPNHHGSAVYVISEVAFLARPGASDQNYAELFPRRRFSAGADSPPRTPPVAMPKKLIGRDATATLGSVAEHGCHVSLNNTVKLLSILRPRKRPVRGASARSSHWSAFLRATVPRRPSRRRC